ncbi:hypothetical protein [Luteimicrobium sp. DT211]|uniref:hypothetical protein n=1 Tax=Luteimicrobium sp. DT211 TaxID=3393412 RepID=UPI003CF0D19E
MAGVVVPGARAPGRPWCARAAGAVALLVACLAVAGCGASGSPADVDTADGLPVVAAAPGQTYLPWSLDRVDRSRDRVYLVTSNVGCSTPRAAVVAGTASSVTVEVVGSSGKGPCTEKLETLSTYVELPSPLDGRDVLGARPRPGGSPPTATGHQIRTRSSGSR